MGWTVGYSTRREMLDDLQSDARYGDRYQLLKSCTRGNVLWSVIAFLGDAEREPENLRT